MFFYGYGNVSTSLAHVGDVNDVGVTQYSVVSESCLFARKHVLHHTTAVVTGVHDCEYNHVFPACTLVTCFVMLSMPYTGPGFTQDSGISISS